MGRTAPFGEQEKEEVTAKEKKLVLREHDRG